MTALKMAKKSSKATLGDLQNVNKVIKKVRMKKNEVVFTKIGKKEDLVVNGIGDASYKVDEKAIGGNLVLLRNKKNEKVLPLYWKLKIIKKVCHSSKEAETKNILKLVDESLYQAKMVEQILFDDETKVEVDLFTNSKPLLDSIASTKQVETKMMRPVIADMKDKLIDSSVKSFKWMETRKMVADILTKEKVVSKDVDDIVYRNIYEGIGEETNKVIFNGAEVKMTHPAVPGVGESVDN